MKNFIFALCFVSTNVEAQTFTNLHFGALYASPNNYPANFGNHMKDKGFKLINKQYIDETHYSFNYVLKEEDEFYFNVFIILQGEYSSIQLTFNDKSKAKEYDKMCQTFKKYLVQLNDENKNGQIFKVYDDDGKLFYLTSDFYSVGFNQQMYTIQILNWISYIAFKDKK